MNLESEDYNRDRIMYKEGELICPVHRILLNRKKSWSDYYICPQFKKCGYAVNKPKIDAREYKKSQEEVNAAYKHLIEVQRKAKDK
jgi:hypothetical protein